MAEGCTIVERERSWVPGGGKGGTFAARGPERPRDGKKKRRRKKKKECSFFVSEAGAGTPRPRGAWLCASGSLSCRPPSPGPCTLSQKGEVAWPKRGPEKRES